MVRVEEAGYVVDVEEAAEEPARLVVAQVDPVTANVLDVEGLDEPTATHVAGLVGVPPVAEPVS